MIIDDRSAFDRAESIRQRHDFRDSHLSYGLKLQFFSSFEAAAPIWKVFERRAVSSPFQSYSWLENWYRHRGQQAGVMPLLVFGYDRLDRLRVVMPLGVSRRSKIVRLGWLGDELTGLNAPVVDPAYISGLSEAALSAMFAETVRQVGDIDIIDLVHQPSRLGGHINPLTRTAEPMAHAVNSHVQLPSDWEQFGSVESRRQRAADSQRRRQRLRERGEIGLRLNAAPGDCAEIIDTAFASAGRAGKAEWSESALAQPGVVDFFKSLSAGPNACPLSVSAIEAGGALLAVAFGYSCRQSYLQAFTLVERSQHGTVAERLLLEETIRSCIVRGVDAITFLGDTAAEAVAGIDADTEPLGQTRVGVTPRGKLAVAGARLRRRWLRGEGNEPERHHCRRHEFPAPDEHPLSPNIAR